MKLMLRYISCSLLLIVFFQDCKKGEDDPFLSLRTRKNRVTGSWSLKSGTLDVHIERTTTTIDQHFEYTESDLSYKESPSAAVGSGISHHLNLELDKKGHFVMEEENNGIVFKAEGDWDFESGTGKAKNKEYIQLKIKTVNQGKLDYYNNFNKGVSNFAYRIKELRNKKLVLVSDKNMVYKDSGGDKLWTESEFEFAQ